MQESVLSYLELAKVYLRLDQPNTALDTYLKAVDKFPGDIHLLLGIARVYEALNDITNAIAYYKKVRFNLSLFLFLMSCAFAA